ncbi:MAG: DsbC family protein, partial [candidate division WOR-3 bacterium]
IKGGGVQMKRIFLFLLFLLLGFSWSALAKMSKEEFLKKSPHLMKLIETSGGLASFEGFKDIGPLYEVIIKTVDGKKIAYITKDFKYLIIGSLYDKDIKNITQEKVRELNKIDITKLPLNEALIYKAGNGTKKIIVFVDPFCPHCKNLINYLKTQNDYTLYMYLFPLNEKSKEVALKIFCSNEPIIDAYLNATKLENPCEDADKKLEAHLNVAKSLNVRATPFVILGDGLNFYGMNQQMLEEFFRK